MTETGINDLTRVPRYRARGGKPKFSAGSKVCWAVSSRSENQRGRYAAGVALWLQQQRAQHGIDICVLINDTGNDYTLQIDGDITPEQARVTAQNIGNDWAFEVGPILKACGIRDKTGIQKPLDDETFMRWEKFRNNSDKLIRAEFERTVDAFEFLPKIDAAYAADLEESVEVFDSRHFRDVPEIPHATRANRARRRKFSRNFLTEENAIFAMAGRRYDALVYTGPLQKCFQRACRGEFDIPADLSEADLPESVRTAVKPGQTAAAALREALSGFDRMQYIQLKATGSYTELQVEESTAPVLQTLSRAYTFGDKAIAPGMKPLSVVVAEHKVLADVTKQPLPDDLVDILEGRAPVGPRRPNHDTIASPTADKNQR